MALVVALLAATAPAAGAATVTTRERYESDDKTYARIVTEIAFEAAPGEANRLVATHEGAVWRMRDNDAAITPGGVCRAVTEHDVLCEPATRDSEVLVALGDGDDTLLAAGDVRADGGVGDDRIVAAEADGGPGDDVLEGHSLGGGPGCGPARDLRRTRQCRRRGRRRRPARR